MDSLRREYYRMSEASSKEASLTTFMGEALGMLHDRGYSLLGSDGRPLGAVGDLAGAPSQPLDTGFFLSTPNAGYRVKCQVGGDGTLTFEHMRVAASKEEALAASDYQRGLDQAEGQKWCSVITDLEAAIPGAARKVLREPSEAIPVIIDKNLRAVKAQAAPAARARDGEE
jgi:hypothetical protein